MFKTRSSCENKLIQFKQSPNGKEKGDLGIKFFFSKNNQLQTNHEEDNEQLKNNIKKFRE